MKANEWIIDQLVYEVYELTGEEIGIVKAIGADFMKALSHSRI